MDEQGVTMRYLLLFLTFALISACGDERAPTDAQPDAADAVSLPAINTGDLPGFFDCVRDSGGVLIASHRAGPAPGYPENALETLQYGYAQGIRIFEIDIATSRDGVLFLMHDRSLGRTTTTGGAVADKDWNDIARSRLVDNDGKTTSFHPPKLTDVLLWAKDTGAVLELDKKETTGWRSVISAVRAADAGNNVLLITYNDKDAGLVQRLAPNMMLTAGARGGRDLAKLEALGVNSEMVVAWTGTRSPDKGAWQRNAREGVESAFGTLGRKSERLDTEYWADGDPSEYRKMIRDGLVMLATDEPYRLADAIVEDDRALNACGGQAGILD